MNLPVVGWGWNYYNQTTVSANLSNVVAVAAREQGLVQSGASVMPRSVEYIFRKVLHRGGANAEGSR